MHKKQSPSIIGIVAKASEPLAIDLTKQLLQWIEQHSYEWRIDVDVGLVLGLAPETERRMIKREELPKLCDPIVVLGGDGTLISVSRHAKEHSPVIIGVNVGTLGFLTEITVDELFLVLGNVLAKKARLERRFLLTAEVVQLGEKQKTFYAINDVVITKEALARIFRIELLVNEEFAATLCGDGVIVSTPGGSTAYSLSAGGSIVHPQVDAILVTPICPHSLTSRPLVVPGSSQICLRIAASAKPITANVFLTIDGQEGFSLSEGDEVLITTSDSSVLFAKSPSKNYFEVLGTKLKWAE